VAGCCEYGNEPVFPCKVGNFLTNNVSELLMKVCVPCSFVGGNGVQSLGTSFSVRKK
jgi:hypothetical protein